MMGLGAHIICSFASNYLTMCYLSFYDNVEQAQGKQGIYYTGGFLSFELVDNTMKATEDLIDRYF